MASQSPLIPHVAQLLHAQAPHHGAHKKIDHRPRSKNSFKTRCALTGTVGQKLFSSKLNLRSISETSFFGSFRSFGSFPNCGKVNTRRRMPIATCEASVAVLGFLSIDIGRSSILVLAAKFKEEVRNKTAANVRVSEGLGKKPRFSCPTCFEILARLLLEPPHAATAAQIACSSCCNSCPGY